MQSIKLENIAGKLINIYSQFQPETIQHASEIMNDKRTNEGLRNQWFWTADFSMYQSKGKEPVLYMTDWNDNLIFQNIEEAVKQIIASNNYRPTENGIKAVLDAAEKGNALKLFYSDLKLKKHDDEFSYFEINTGKPEKLNDAQIKFAKRVHGRTDSDFSVNMKMLKDVKIDTTRIYFLNPKYVLEQLKDNKDGAIARASRLYAFGSNSDFNAGGRFVGNVNVCLRGVRKVAEGAGLIRGAESLIAEGDVAKNLVQKAEKSALELEDILSVINNPDFNRADMVKAITALYSKR